MAYIDKMNIQEICTEGKSPADVYRGHIDGKLYYLKTINNIFSKTTYSVKREAEIMEWLGDKLNVPSVIEYGNQDDLEYLIMSELKGQHIDSFITEPLQYIKYLAKAIQKIHSVDISCCKFSSRLDVRLQELKYLLDNNLADIDISNWEATTGFGEPMELYDWLCNNKPKEELCFSHGDVCANFFIANDEIYFYDLARCGIADKWVDIALCVRKIRRYYPDSNYEREFFHMLGIEPDYEKIDYYILLDEMF